MRILVVGSGGVGAAVVAIATRRQFFEHLTVADLDVGKIDLYLDDVLVAKAGGRNPDYREEDGQRVMKKSEIAIRVLLGRGDAQATIWTCDLSHDYVSINADYRS